MFLDCENSRVLIQQKEHPLINFKCAISITDYELMEKKNDKILSSAVHMNSFVTKQVAWLCCPCLRLFLSMIMNCFSICPRKGRWYGTVKPMPQQDRPVAAQYVPYFCKGLHLLSNFYIYSASSSLTLWSTINGWCHSVERMFPLHCLHIFEQQLKGRALFRLTLMNQVKEQNSSC